MRSAKWPSVIFRIFGLMTFLVAVVSGFFTLIPTITVEIGGAESTPDAPHFVAVFFAMVAINLAFEVLLAIAGILLWQAKTVGLTICNAIFPAEILYSLIVFALWSPGLSGGLGTSIAGATGVGNGGLVVQWITGYPVIALVVLNVLRPRLDPSPAATTTLAAQS
jgi:hypothetical protein